MIKQTDKEKKQLKQLLGFLLNTPTFKGTFIQRVVKTSSPYHISKVCLVCKLRTKLKCLENIYNVG